MNKTIKPILIIALFIVTVISFSTLSYAAKGFEGYAVYRDQAVGEHWHAALMNYEHPQNTNAVVQASNIFNTVRYGTWDSFIPGEKVFKGFYYPFSGIPSSDKRNDIVATAQALANQNITYTILQQINYSSGSNIKVQPEDITFSRCDGVVEYSYEYNGIRIYGNDNYWDISKRGSSNKNHHSGTLITPEDQAQIYMIEWQPKYKIVYALNYGNGKVLDICGPSSSDGTIVQQWSYVRASNQKFRIDYNILDYCYSFIPQNALNSAIEVQNNLNVVGTPVQIWTVPNNGYLNSQKFKIYQNSKGAYKIASYGSGYSKVIKPQYNNSNNGVPINLYSDSSTDYQYWFFIPA